MRGDTPTLPFIGREDLRGPSGDPKLTGGTITVSDIDHVVLNAGERKDNASVTVV